MWLLPGRIPATTTTGVAQESFHALCSPNASCGTVTCRVIVPIGKRRHLSSMLEPVSLEFTELLETYLVATQQVLCLILVSTSTSLACQQAAIAWSYTCYHHNRRGAGKFPSFALSERVLRHRHMQRDSADWKAPSVSNSQNCLKRILLQPSSFDFDFTCMPTCGWRLVVYLLPPQQAWRRKVSKLCFLRTRLAAQSHAE